MSVQERTGEFVRLLTASQRPLYAFIRSQVYSRTDADELLQQTTAVLWEKFETFDQSQSFIRWACGVAWREVLLHRRNSRRRKLALSDELGEHLAAKLASAAAEVDRRLDFLQECLAGLKPQSRRLIERRYYLEEDVERIAARANASESSIYKTLTKVRQLLLDCIQRKLKEER
jgi:RNA polymerase sigma-70 factor (ECF subfamily)